MASRIRPFSALAYGILWRNVSFKLFWFDRGFAQSIFDRRYQTSVRLAKEPPVRVGRDIKISKKKIYTQCGGS